MSSLAGSSALRLRQLSRLLVPILVVVVAVAVLARNHLVQSQTSAQTGTGPVLKGYGLDSVPAPTFALTDQNGRTISLRALAGRPVVLTFLYTHCPDECPLTAEKLRRTVQTLGARASVVAWLAVSIDPVGDTPQAALDFVAKHHLSGVLHFLVGSQRQLHPIWTAYHIAVARGDADTAASQQGGALVHSAAVYLIDARGDERALYTSAFAPDDLASDLRALLGR